MTFLFQSQDFGRGLTLGDHLTMTPSQMLSPQHSVAATWPVTATNRQKAQKSHGTILQYVCSYVMLCYVFSVVSQLVYWDVLPIVAGKIQHFHLLEATVIDQDSQALDSQAAPVGEDQELFIRFSLVIGSALFAFPVFHISIFQLPGRMVGSLRSTNWIS